MRGLAIADHDHDRPTVHQGLRLRKLWYVPMRGALNLARLAQEWR